MAMAGNRLGLLMVELQEERNLLLQTIMLSLGIATLGLLGSMTLTATLVVLFWDYSKVLLLSILTLIYLGGALLFYRRLVWLRKTWRVIPSTMEQLRKDRECLEQELM